LRRCPHLLNLAAKLVKNSKNEGKKARSTHVLPTHKLEEDGRLYHFPSYTSSLNKQTKTREKCTSRLEKDKRRLEIATKLPQGVL
jgi:hypothetical protein